MLRSDRIIALDIGASKLVMAEFLVEKGSPIQLMDYGIERLDVDPEKETDASAYIVSAIRELMRRKSIKPAPLLMTVSGQAVFPRYVPLPPVARDKLLQIISYEAEQNVPFPIDEVVWDYQLMGGEESELNVMLVAAKIESITRLTDCVQAANLEPEIVDVAPMAIYNAVRYSYPDLRGCTMILDIGARSTNLVFGEGNRIFSRSIPVAGNTLTHELMKDFDISFAEAEELKKTNAFVAFGGVYAGPESETADRVSKIVRNVITRLHAEINRSINFYRGQQKGSPPSMVLLTGGSSIIPYMDTFFREKLKVEVEYLNPFVNIAASPSLSDEQIAGDMHLLAEVVGLALRRGLTCPVEINLMPPELVARKTFRRRQPFLALSAIGLVLIMFCWWGYVLRMQSTLGAKVAKVEEKIGAVRSVLGRLESIRQDKEIVTGKIDSVLDVIGRRTAWVEMIDAIHGCMLDGMWLTSVRPAIKDDLLTDIRVSGKGFVDKLDVPAIEGFAEKLKQSRFFSDDSKIIKLPVVGSKDVVREFTIELVLEKPLRLD